MAEGRVNIVHPIQGVKSIPEADLQAAINRGWRLESSEEGGKRALEEHYGQGKYIPGAVATGALRTLTGGLFDVVARAAGNREEVQGIRESHPYASTAGEVGAALLPVGAPGLISKAGAGAAKALGGKILGTAARGVVEGGLYGAGQGVSEVALDEKPITAERVASVVGSNALYGAAIGGGVGLGAGLLSRGAQAAKSWAQKAAAPAEEIADVATLKAQLPEKLSAVREATKESKWWVHADSETKAQAWKADKRIRTLLNNPKDLVDQGRQIRTALRAQEHALDTFLSKADEMKAGAVKSHGVEGLAESSRFKALESAQKLKDLNLGLQAHVDQLLAPPAAASGKLGLLGQGVKHGVYGAAMAVTAPVLGPWAGGLLAGKASEFAEAVMLGKMGKKLATGALEVAERNTKAVDAFLNVAEKGSRVAPVAASSVLGKISYASTEAVAATPARAQVASKNPKVETYRQREREILSQIETGPNGKAQMSFAARKTLHDRLSGVAAVNPFAADAIETVAARRIAYLADKLPKRPQTDSLPIGPDRWHPSEMEIASFARTAAAVEDPVSVVERMTDGSATPEDAEALRTVYPEMFADMQRQIIDRLPQLQESLPYSRRLAMSIVWGVPVDPAMDPRIMAVLQGSFDSESQGPPKAMNPRGTAKSLEKPTNAQERAG